jgi:CheY-like chemotaxis protein
MRSRIPGHSDARVSESAVRVLVADDDATSCRFLADGLQAVTREVATCGDGPSALQRARSERFDLLLVDCRMPGAGALAIAHALRADPRAASHAAALVATSAEFAAEDRRALLSAGCNGILDKPCTLAELRHTMSLIPTLGDAVLVLDDVAGLRSSGDYVTLAALRQLLGEELEAMQLQFETLATDPLALIARLHRLRAGCGFCGTTRLARAAQELKLKLELEPGADHTVTIDEFQAALAATRHALETHLRASPT